MGKRLIYAALAVGIALCSGTAQSTRTVEWILEDGLDDEYVRVSMLDLATPAEYKEAVEHYKKGEYRLAAVKLEKLKDLKLPDGNTDFLCFCQAECYRMLGLQKAAEDNYRYIVNRFPESELSAPALFRLMHYACAMRSVESADSAYNIFEARYKNHPLYNSVVYSVGLLYYRIERYGEAIEILTKVAKNSARHYQAQLAASLCHIRLGRTEKALFHLEYVRKNCLDKGLVAEAAIIIGDIYYTQGNFQTALKYYAGIQKNAPRYFYSQVKTARVHMELKEYGKALALASGFIEHEKHNAYFFEMASILEQAYGAQGNKARAGRINNQVYKQIIDAKTAFDVDKELSAIYDMAARWKWMRFEAMNRSDAKLAQEADMQLERLGKLAQENRTILRGIGILTRVDGTEEVPGFAHRRFLSLMHRDLIKHEDSVQVLLEELRRMRSKSARSDSAFSDSVARMLVLLDSARQDLNAASARYDEVRRVVRDNTQTAEVFSDEMQAKFIDWSFMQYLDRKNTHKEMSRNLSGARTHVPDSAPPAKNASRATPSSSSIDIDNLEIAIADERLRLAGHIETFLEFNPNNVYVPQILFRLAELYYDESVDDFGRRLKSYEARLAQASADTAGLEFPEYKLDKTIAIYDKLIAAFPHDWLADDAHFYKALALQKLVRLDEANAVLVALVEKYPESEFFVEANMQIGRYYFENPRIADEKGYELAQKAYRQVLQYRDHPQFVEALYHLGWCYYMQDSYSEAISVFKYLIEEVDLDFDPRKMEEKQLTNPLLREEAIDYIAISFDEEGNVDEAIRFLELVGNPDYAAMVLKRIAELREEDMDYATAETVYRKILERYPLSLIAPEATVCLVKIYETTNKAGSAMKEREAFFERFSRGSEWQKEAGKRDENLIAEIDSMAISTGMFVGDVYYRNAEQQKDSSLHEYAAQSYRKLVKKYPSDSRAGDARWNLAVILETRLKNPTAAYGHYIEYSGCANFDTQRRERAALNAIAIAQGRMQADPPQDNGKLPEAAIKTIDACRNYIKLFRTGTSLSDVVLTYGSVYFNRKMFAKAAEAFSVLTKLGPQVARYYEACFLVGKCYFGQEQWVPAADAFEKIWYEGDSKEQKEDAYKLMLQARYLYAKQLFDQAAFEKAAACYLDIEKAYPGSDYGDIVLFSAAEAYEKMEQWIKACACYHDLIKKYPGSKFAADALFNAAGNYEKAEDNQKAAKAYEILVSQYPSSDKAKDGLFNLGFCYEKLGELDKMAEANERYTKLYPEEKDVEAMLMRSAHYYMKAAKYEKTISICRNFVRRYERNPHAVEAYFMEGNCWLAQGDTAQAQTSFMQCENLNANLRSSGAQTNDYFAAEASYADAGIRRLKLSSISLESTAPKLIKETLKKKSDLLAEAAKAYQRVMQYKSERMFDAAYYIGKMYEELALDWSRQKPGETDPIKIALAAKDINIVASSLLQKAHVPYKKALDLASAIDSVSKEQALWIDSAKAGIVRIYPAAGEFLVASARAMENAPIPEEIKKQQIYLFQYSKQLIETLAPMRTQIRDYYMRAAQELAAFPFASQTADACREEFSRYNFLIPNYFDTLAELIILATDNLPKEMSDEEREEMVFQFEDMVFELQDKAIFGYEDALADAREQKTTASPWYRQIQKRLARLSPERYGKDIFVSRGFSSGPDWFVRSDKVDKWATLDAPRSGWQQAKKLAGIRLGSDTADVIWAASEAAGIYLWKPFFLNGEVRDAILYFATGAPYVLYINGKTVSDDTAGIHTLDGIDSVKSIHQMLNGGDNVIAVALRAPAADSRRGIAVRFSALLDTTQQFSSKMNLPEAQSDAGRSTHTAPQKSAPAGSRAEPSSGAQAPVDYARQFRNKGELLNAIEGYTKKEQASQAQIKRERLEIQKMQIKHDALDKSIDAVKKEIAELKESLGAMKRKR